MKLTIAHNLKETLRAEVDELNQNLEKLAGTTDGYLGDLLSYVLKGSGKRVRPALVFLSSRLGSAKKSDAQVVAQAVELVHIATLVHDDVIDNALLRRNRKTVANQDGVEAAVLLGDHIFTYAFQQVAKLNQPILIELLAGSTAIMCGGEIDQLKKRFQFTLSEADYFSFIQKKTASLFGASARCGAVLAGQDLKIQTALESFGNHLGIAFQIKDDLLDLTGEESVVGKTLRTDLVNGKMTLPLIHYREHLASKKESDELMETLQHPNGQISGLIEKIRAAGSLAYAETVTISHVKEALSELDKLPRGDARDYLASLAEILLSRNA